MRGLAYLLHRRGVYKVDLCDSGVRRSGRKIRIGQARVEDETSAGIDGSGTAVLLIMLYA